MSPSVAVALEVGARRTFAVAIDWPGWSRSGRNPDEALANLLAYGPRYRAATDVSPADPTLEVVETVAGGSGTDFGVPITRLAGDERPFDRSELARQLPLLTAAWEAFDRAIATAGTLRSGPRGGGRQVAAMAAHVFEAEQAYLVKIGSRAGHDLADTRTRAVGALTARVDGIAVPDPSSSTSLWSPRYYLRRSTWHALDHAWEIEDRRE